MRSSLHLLEDLRRIWAGCSVPVLSGNLGDLHVGPEGTIVGFEQILTYAAAANGLGLVRWSPARGTVQEPPPGRASIPFRGPGPDADLAEAIRHLLAELERCPTSMVALIDWASPGLGQPGEAHGPAIELLASAATDPVLASRGHRLAVTDRTGSITDALQGFPAMRNLRVLLPDLDERTACLTHFYGTDELSPGVAQLDPSAPLERVAAAAGGLSLRRLIAMMGEVAHDGGHLGPAAIDPVKRQFLVEHTEGTLLPISAGSSLDELAGLENIRLFVSEFSQSSIHARHLVLAGPPGVGKSSVIGGVARALGVAVVAMGDIRAQYVGESERRCRAMIAAAHSLAPVIIFIDEIDQVLAGDHGPTGDSGVTSRINAMLWEWTGEVGNDPGVIVIGATNRPRALGTRAEDRFTTIPVLHPDARQGARILAISAARGGRSVDSDAALELLAGRAIFTGRTLAEIYKNTAILADRRKGGRCEHLDGEALAAGIGQILGWPDDVEQEYMALDAIRATRVRRYLPWEAARLLDVAYKPPAYMSPLLHHDGTLDGTALSARMTELGARRGTRS